MKIIIGGYISLIPISILAIIWAWKAKYWDKVGFIIYVLWVLLMDAIGMTILASLLQQL